MNTIRVSNGLDPDQDWPSEHIKSSVSLLVTLCILGNFLCLSCRLLTFSKLTFSKKCFVNTIRESNGLDLDQDWPDLGPTVCKGFQQMKKVNASKERVNPSCHSGCMLSGCLSAYTIWKPILQKIWTVIRLLLKKQSDLGLYLLQYMIVCLHDGK